MPYLLNARFLAAPTGGVSRVGRELLRALLEEMAERRPGDRPDIEIASPPGVEVEGAAGAGIRVRRGAANHLQEQLLLPWTRPGATVVNFANAAPLMASSAIVWIHDAHVFEAPDSYGLRYRLWHRNMLRMSVGRGFSIVTVSNYSREALIRHGADPARTTVIHNGGDHILRVASDPVLADNLGLARDGFVLLVGSRARHKNLPFAARALAQGLPPEVRIVIAGLHQPGEYAADAQMPDDPRILILPPVTDGQLRALYERARCVVVPSLLEGFSLPAAEALWCGAPLALANRTALVEVGGPAAVFFEPDDAEGLVAAVIQAGGDRRQALASAGAEHREKFRWNLAARRLLEGHLAV